MAKFLNQLGDHNTGEPVKARTNSLQNKRCHNQQTVGRNLTSPTEPKFYKQNLIQSPKQWILVPSAPSFLKCSLQLIGNCYRAAVRRDKWYVVGFQRPRIPKVHQRAHPHEGRSAQDPCVGLAADTPLRRHWWDWLPS